MKFWRHFEAFENIVDDIMNTKQIKTRETSPLSTKTKLTAIRLAFLMGYGSNKVLEWFLYSI